MKSIIVFTTNKAASMLLYELAKKITRACGMPFYSINDGTFPEKELGDDPTAFAGKEGCFCPIRYYADVPDIADYDVIVHLRDPRDAITSQFFSLAYSHPPVAGSFKPSDAERRDWIAQGVDAHARKHADAWLARYEAYVDNLLGRPNTIVVTYEQMVTDFEYWLRRFIGPFPVADKEKLIRKLVRRYRNNFKVKREDVNRQKRQITPGDHKRKLQPETIAFLNEKFGSVLAALGYEP